MIDIQRIRNNIDNFYKNKEKERQQDKISRRNKRWEKYYNSKYWQQLRNNYYNMHPICQCCEKEGLIIPATEVHHVTRFSSGINETDKWNLLLNKNNLISLCSDCHDKAHIYMQRYNTDTAGVNEILQIKQELKKAI